jgi:hypothetical protein
MAWKHTYTSQTQYEHYPRSTHTFTSAVQHRSRRSDAALSAQYARTPIRAQLNRPHTSTRSVRSRLRQRGAPSHAAASAVQQIRHRVTLCSTIGPAPSYEPEPVAARPPPTGRCSIPVALFGEICDFGPWWTVSSQTQVLHSHYFSGSKIPVRVLLKSKVQSKPS